MRSSLTVIACSFDVEGRRVAKLLHPQGAGLDGKILRHRKPGVRQAARLHHRWRNRAPSIITAHPRFRGAAGGACPNEQIGRPDFFRRSICCLTKAGKDLALPAPRRNAKTRLEALFDGKRQDRCTHHAFCRALSPAAAMPCCNRRAG